MSKYKVWVQLEAEYDDIEAENKDEAFTIASNYAIKGGCWECAVEEIKEEEEK